MDQDAGFAFWAEDKGGGHAKCKVCLTWCHTHTWILRALSDKHRKNVSKCRVVVEGGGYWEPCPEPCMPAAVPEPDPEP